MVVWLALITILMRVLLRLTVLSDEIKQSPQNAERAAADQQFRVAKFATAETSYPMRARPTKGGRFDS
jgi:hypothetical protein